ncbi:TPA: phage tail protein [Serratia marcescens]
MSEFFSILTNAGAEKLALAANTGQPMAISVMAVGDGAGVTPTPSPEQTKLHGEQYRSELNALTLVSEAANVISAEMIIPPEFGGFWIREVGLYADDGVLVAVGSLPDTYKSNLAEGSGRNSVIRVELAVSSTKDVQLLIDPSVVIATTGYVDNLFHRALNRADDAYALAKSKLSFDDAYPIGETKFFATAFDPNKKWPGTHWIQLAENRTIRTANSEGSNVLEAGGSDSITIARENLPADKIKVAGSTNEHDTGMLSTDDYHFSTKTTGDAGAHKTRGRYIESNTSLDGGASDRRSWSVNYGFNDEGLVEETPDHTHQFELEDHKHTIQPIKHDHSVNAETDELGQGEEIRVVNSYIVLAGWYRAA